MSSPPLDLAGPPTGPRLPGPAFGGHQVSLAGLASPSRIAAAGGWGRSVARLGSASIVTAVWNLSFCLYNRDRPSSVSISFTHLSLSE